MSEGDGDHAVATLRGPLADLPDPLPVPTLAAGASFRVSITPPGSKSLTNRALLLAALARGESVLRRPLLDAEDSDAMCAGLRALGAGVERRGDDLRVRGVGGRFHPGGPVTLRLNNAGTAVRFLAAAAALSDAEVTIDGSPRMRERPIGALVSALRELGAATEFLGREGCPPVRITPPRALRATRVALPAGESSQFLSALLLIAPSMPHGLRVTSAAPPPSAPYAEMTARLLRRVGAHDVTWAPDFTNAHAGASPGGMAAFTLDIEPDATGATYFWAAAAIGQGSSCVVPGLSGECLQGDVGFAAVLARMGARVSEDENGLRVSSPPAGAALVGGEFDMDGMPDAAMTLATVACFARGPTRITGLGTLRVKETDRLSALGAELTRLGASVRIEGDALEITPAPDAAGASPAPVVIETYRDHRMAMAFALAGLRRPGVLIRDPGCVGKTYPGFWADLARLHHVDDAQGVMPRGAGDSLPRA